MTLTEPDNLLQKQNTDKHSITFPTAPILTKPIY